MKYAVSYLTQRDIFVDGHSMHQWRMKVDVIDALTDEDALGKAIFMARKDYRQLMDGGMTLLTSESTNKRKNPQADKPRFATQTLTCYTMNWLEGMLHLLSIGLG